MLNRVIWGIVMALAVIMLLVFDNLYIRLFVGIALMLLSNYEISNAYGKVYDKFSRWPGWIFSVLLVPSKYLLGVNGFAFTIIVTIIAFLVLYVLKNSRMKKTEITSTISSFLSMLYPLMLFEFLISALMLETPHWRSVIIFAVGIAVLTDCFALFGGLLFGKSKLSPGISPNKTWAGAISGFLIGGVGASVLYYYIQSVWGGTLSLPVCIVAGTLMSILAEFGDLVASSIKRATGIKDFGNLIPGHGGVLDRLDSILFALPVAYYAVILQI